MYINFNDLPFAEIVLPARAPLSDHAHQLAARNYAIWISICDAAIQAPAPAQIAPQDDELWYEWHNEYYGARYDHDDPRDARGYPFK